jgi:3-dehydroquinate synthase
MEKINCNLISKKYDIIIDNNVLDCLKDFTFNRVFIITDDIVNELYSEKIKESLLKINKEALFIVFKNGERSKNLKTVEYIYNQLNQNNITKSDIIIALGGGVVGDVAGFVASTFLRGIRIIQIPTTLLSMVDSSIGGKSGVDMPYGKNLVGSIYKPEAVLINPDFLNTLPKRQIKSGMAEVIKCGLIGDVEIINELEKKNYDIQKIIYLTARFKAQTVSKDEFENNIRMILNFGHTLGHSIELLGNYRKYTHGEAVAIGTVYALKLSIKILNMDKTINERAFKVLRKFNLPIDCSYNIDEMTEIIKKDKKMRGDNINFILLQDITQPIIKSIEISALKELLKEI